MDEVYRRCAGGRGMGWALGVGGKLKAGNTIHKEANSSIVSSVRHRNCHNQPGRLRQLSAAVTHHLALLVPISGPIEPVVDHCGLTGLAKDRL